LNIREHFLGHPELQQAVGEREADGAAGGPVHHPDAITQYRE
jgi:hypothetical protein